MIRRCVQLATAARELSIHVIGTEENPAGLGPLVPEVASSSVCAFCTLMSCAPPSESRVMARANVTMGEMCDALRDVWGEYQEQPMI